MSPKCSSKHDDAAAQPESKPLRTHQESPLYLAVLSPYTPSPKTPEHKSTIPCYLRPKHKYLQTFDPQTPQQIRLLKLLPYNTHDRWTHPIHCTLSITSLTLYPKYIALSYTWSAANLPATLPIYVDGGIFHATGNLVAALRHLRRERECVCLWVDAVCIDQGQHSTEKESQIPLMGAIYSQAALVVAWLGVGDEESDGAMGMLDEIGTYCLQNIPAGRGFYAKRMEYISHVLSENDGKPFPLKAICTILTMKWWSRIWCLQEVELAQEVLLMCGTQTIPFEILWYAHEALKSFSLMEGPPSHLINISNEIRRTLLQDAKGIIDTTPRSTSQARYGPSTFPCSLSRKIEQTNDMQATDPRDFVYAILSVVEDAEELGIRYEPNLKCSALWMKVAIALMRQSQNLKVLGWCQQFRHASPEIPADKPTPTNGILSTLFSGSLWTDKSSNIPLDILENDDRENLPSWVPNLSVPNNFIFSNPGMDDRDRLYNASKNIPFSFAEDVSFDEERRSMTITGFRLDSIRLVSPSPPLSAYFDSEHHLKEMSRLIQFQFLLRNLPRDQEAFYRTPICDLELKLETKRDTTTFRRQRGKYTLYESFRAMDVDCKPPADVENGREEKKWRWEMQLEYAKIMRVCYEGRNSFLTREGAWVGLGPMGGMWFVWLRGRMCCLF